MFKKKLNKRKESCTDGFMAVVQLVQLGMFPLCSEVCSNALD